MPPSRDRAGGRREGEQNRLERRHRPAAGDRRRAAARRPGLRPARRAAPGRVPGREGGLSARRGRHVRRAGRAGRDGVPRGPAPARPGHRVRGPGLRPARPAAPAPCTTSAGWASADENSQPLVVDWRAPAAAAFYRATAGRAAGRGPPPDDPVQPASGSPASRTTCSTRRPRRRTCGSSATARCWPACPRPPARGMRDIVATIQREQDEAIRSPASGVTIVTGGPGTGKTAVALHRAAYLLYSDRNRFAGGGILVVGPSGGVRRLHRDRAAVARRGHRDAALARLAGRRATTPTRVDPTDGRRDQGLAADAPGAASGPRTTRCRAARPSCGCSTAARCCAWTPAELDRIRRRALPRGARRNEVRGAGFDRRLRRAVGAGPAAQVAQPAGEARLRGRAGRPRRLPGLPAGPGGRGFTPMRVLGWLADPARLRPYANGRAVPRRDRAAAGLVRRLAEQGPTIADVALLDELDELMGRPRQPQRKTTQPVPRAGRGPGGQHVRGPAGARPAPSRCSATTTTATTRTSWWTRRRTSRRCSGG